MSVCNCPIVDPEVQKKLVTDFIVNETGPLQPGQQAWNLLNVADMYLAGNSIQQIAEVIPFRGGPCSRSMRCCGACTRQCYHRCVQDCLQRLYEWRCMVESTPSTERDKLPLNLRLVVNQHFESLEDLSWVVGEIVSQTTNPRVKEYMTNAQLQKYQNPNKKDYAPQAAISESSGRRVCDPSTGELRFLAWPKTGLCPFCLPNVTIDGRVARKARREAEAAVLDRTHMD